MTPGGGAGFAGAVQPILVEANDNQPLNSTDVYSGLFAPGATATARVPAVPPHPVAPSRGGAHTTRR